MIEVCPHGISLAHKDQCTSCWLLENSDWGKLLAANQRIAELERAAETSRAEHAAALAEAKRREDKAVELTVVTHAGNVKLHADRETLRAELAEHAAALGLATARIRELEELRISGIQAFARQYIIELRPLLIDDYDSVLSGLRNGGAINAVRAVKARIVARIEKAAKGGTTP